MFHALMGRFQLELYNNIMLILLNIMFHAVMGRFQLEL